MRFRLCGRARVLAHTASREGEVAVNTILGRIDAMSYSAIPGIVYTNPEVAGAHLLGNPCSEIIQSLCIAIEHKLTVDQLKKVVFPHPTVVEIVKETLFSL